MPLVAQEAPLFGCNDDMMTLFNQSNVELTTLAGKIEGIYSVTKTIVTIYTLHKNCGKADNRPPCRQGTVYSKTLPRDHGIMELSLITTTIMTCRWCNYMIWGDYRRSVIFSSSATIGFPAAFWQDRKESICKDPHAFCMHTVACVVVFFVIFLQRISSLPIRFPLVKKSSPFVASYLRPRSTCAAMSATLIDGKLNIICIKTHLNCC